MSGLVAGESKAGPAAVPLLSLGVVADVQYADADDGADFKRTVVRRYRNALTVLSRAVDAWRAQPARRGYPVQCVAQLGDLLDGRCRERDGNAEVCLRRVLDALDRMGPDVPRCDVIGNHELYVFSRIQLADADAGPLRTARHDALLGRASTFYSFLPAGEGSRVRIVVLDAFDLSTLNGAGAPSTAVARALLKRHNPNDIDRKGVDWTTGLHGTELRHVPYNGAAGPEQLRWLRETLVAALAASERCIVLSHVALIPGACSLSCVLWNYDAVLRILHDPLGKVVVGGGGGDDCNDGDGRSDSPVFGPTPVVCCLYGHAHKGGYRVDGRGIHHVTFQAPLEAVGDEASWAVVDVMEDHVAVRGAGRVPSRERLAFPPPHQDVPMWGVVDENALAQVMLAAAVDDRTAAVQFLNVACEGVLEVAMERCAVLTAEAAAVRGGAGAGSSSRGEAGPNHA